MTAKAVESASPDWAAWNARPEAVAPERAAQAFESMLLAQILERAQTPIFESSLFGGGSASAIYRSLFAKEVADRMAARGGFGLAAAVTRQLRTPEPEKP